MNFTIYVVKTKALISFAVTAKLIHVFVFEYTKSQFSQDAALMSCVIRKSAFCICENKGADQLRGNRVVDQPLCFS